MTQKCCCSFFYFIISSPLHIPFSSVACQIAFKVPPHATGVRMEVSGGATNALVSGIKGVQVQRLMFEAIFYACKKKKGKSLLLPVRPF